MLVSSKNTIQIQNIFYLRYTFIKSIVKKTKKIMNRNTMLTSESNPSLLSPNLSGSRVNLIQSSASLGDLHHQYNTLVNNVEEVREMDARLGEGIYDTRERLLRATKGGNEQILVATGSGSGGYGQQGIVHGGYLNETIKRTQPENWQVSQRTIVQRNGRFDQQRGDLAQRNGGVSVGPRQGDITYRPATNIRSKQRALKVQEDVIELKRIIEQKTTRITQLEFELGQSNLRYSQLQNTPRTLAMGKCHDCERYQGIIRELEVKCTELGRRLQNNEVNRVLGELKNVTLERDSYRNRLAQLEKSSAEEINKLKLIIDRLRVPLPPQQQPQIQAIRPFVKEVTTKPGQNVNNAQYTTEITQLRLDIERYEVTIREKNFRINELEIQIQSIKRNANISKSGQIVENCSSCERKQRQLNEYKKSKNSQFANLTKIYEETSQRLRKLLTKQSQFSSLQKILSQLRQQNSQMRSMNQKYTLQLTKKQQIIIELNSQIFSMGSQGKASADRIFHLEAEVLELGRKLSDLIKYGDGKPKTTSYSQGEDEERRLQRDISVKLWNLEDQNARLTNELLEQRRSNEDFRKNSQNLLQQIQKLNEDKLRMAQQIKKISISYSDSQPGQTPQKQHQIKGYYHTTHLQQLQTLLQSHNYTELNIKINRQLNFKNTTIKQLLWRQRSMENIGGDLEGLLEFGGICYALDEILQRMIEVMEGYEREISAGRGDGQRMRKSGAFGAEKQVASKLEAVQKDLKSKQKQLAQLQSTISTQKQQHKRRTEQFQSKITQLEQNLSHSESQQYEITRKYNELQRQRERQLSEGQIKQSEEVNRTIRSQVEKASQRNMQRISQLQSQVTQLRRQELNWKGQNQKTITEMSEENRALKNQLQEGRSERQKITVQLNEIRIERENLRMQKLQNDQQIHFITTQNEKIKRSKNQLQEAQNLKRQSESQLKKDRDALAAQNEKIRRMKNQLQEAENFRRQEQLQLKNDRDSFAKMRATLNSERDQLQKLKTDVENQKLSKSQKQLQSLRLTLKKREEDIQDLKSDKARLTSQISSLEQQIRRLTEQISSDSSFAYNKIMENNVERTRLESSVREMTEQVGKMERLEARSNSLVKQLEAKTTKLSFIESQLVKIKADFGRESDKNKQLQSEIDRLRNQKVLAQQPTNQSALKEAIDAKNKSESNLMAAENYIQEILNTLKQKSSQSENTIRLMETQIQGLKNKNTASNNNEQQKIIKGFEAQIQELKTKIDQQSGQQNKEITDLKNQLTRVTEQKNKIVKSLTDSETTVRNLQQELRAWQQKYNNEQNQQFFINAEDIKALKYQIDNLKIQLENEKLINSETSNLKIQMKQLRNSIQQVAQERNTMYTNLQNAQIHIEKLNKEIEALKGKKQGSQGISVGVLQGQQSVQQLNLELSKLRQVNKKLQTESSKAISQLKETNNRLSQQIDAEKSKNSREISRLASQLQAERKKSISAPSTKDTLRKQFEKLTTERDQLFSSLTKAEDYILQLQDKAAQAKNQNDQKFKVVNNQLEQALQNVSQLNRQLESLRVTQVSKPTNAKALEDEITRLKAEVETERKKSTTQSGSQRETESLRQQVAALTQSTKGLQGEVTRLKAEVENERRSKVSTVGSTQETEALRKQIAKLQQNLEAAEDEIRRLLGEIQARDRNAPSQTLLKETESLRQQITSLIQSNKSFEVQITRLKGEVEAERRKVVAQETGNKSTESLRQQVVSLTQNIRTLESQVIRLKEELDNERRKVIGSFSSQKETENLRQQISNLTQNNKIMQAQVSKLKGEIESGKRKSTSQANQQQEIILLRQQLTTVTREKDEVYNNLAKAEEYIETKQQEIKNLLSRGSQPTTAVKSTELVKVLADNRNLDQELTKVKDALKEKTSQFIQMESELQRLKKELSTPKIDQSSTQMQIEIKRLRSQLQSQRLKSSRLSSTVAQQSIIVQFESQIRKLTAQNSNLQSNYRQAQTQIQTLQKQNKKIESEIRKSMEQSGVGSGKDVQFTKLSQEYQLLKRKVDELQSQISNLQRILQKQTEEKNTYYNNLANAENYIEQLLKQLNQLKSKPEVSSNVNINVDLTKANEKIKSLTHQISQMESKNKDKEIEAEKLLRTLEIDVQRLRKQLQAQKSINQNSKNFETQLTKLRNQLESEKRKSVNTTVQSVGTEKNVIQELRRQLTQVTDEKKTLYNNLAAAENHIEKISNDLQRAQQDIQTQVSRPTNAKALEDEITRLKAEVETERKKSTTQSGSQRETESLRQQVAALTQSTKGLQGEVTRLKAEVENERRSKANTVGSTQETDALRQQVTKLEQNLQAAEDEIVRLMGEIENERRNAASYQTVVKEAETLRQQLTSLTQTSQNSKILEGEVARLRSEVETERRKTATHVEQQREVEQLKQQVTALTQGNKGMEVEIVRLKEELEYQMKKASLPEILGQQITTLTSSITGLKAELETERTKSSSQAITKSKESETLNQQIAKLTAQLARLKVQLQTQIKKLASHSITQKETDALRQQILTLTSQKDEIYNNLAKAQAYIEAKEQEIKTFLPRSVQQRSTTENNNTQLGRALAQIKDLNHQLAKAKDALKDRNNQYAQLESELQRLRRELDAQRASQSGKQLQSEITKLRNQLAIQKSKPDQTPALETTKKLLQQQISTLIAQKITWQTNLSRAQAEIHRLMQESTTKQQIIRQQVSRENEGKIELLERQLRQVRGRLGELERELDGKVGELARLNREIVETKQMLQAEKSNSSNLSSKLTTKEAQLVKITQQSTQKSTQTRQLQQASTNLSKAQSQILRLDTENTKIIQQSHTIQKQLDRISVMYNQLEQQKIREVGELQEKVRKIIDESQKKVMEVERKKMAEYYQLENSKNGLIEGLNSKIRELNVQVDSLRQELSMNRHLKEENEQLKAKIKEYEIRIEIYISQEKMLEKLEGQNSTILEQLKFLNQELHRLNLQLQRLSAQLKQASSLYETEKSKLTSELELTRKKKDQIYESLIKAQNFITQCEAQINDLRKLLQQQSSKVKQLMSKQQQQQPQIPDQSFQMKKQAQENSRLEQELKAVLARSEQEKNSLMNEIVRMKGDITNLERNLQESQKGNRQKSEEIGRLEQSGKEMSEQQYRESRVRIQSLEEVTFNLERENRRIKDDLEKSQGVAREAKKQKQTLAQELQRKTEQLLRNTSDNNKLAQELERTKQSLARSEQDAQSVLSQLSNTNAAQGTVNQEIIGLKMEISRLNSQLSNKNILHSNLNQQISRLQAEIRNEQNKVNQSSILYKEGEIKAYRQLDQQRQKRRQAQNSLQQAHKYIHQCQSQLTQLQKQLQQQQDLQRSRSQAPSIDQPDQQSIIDTVSKAHQEMLKMEQLNTALTNDNIELMSRVQMLEQEIFEKETEIGRLRQTNAGVQGSLARIGEEFQAFRGVMERAAGESRAKIEGVEKEKNGLLAENYKLHAHIEILEQQISALKNTSHTQGQDNLSRISQLQKQILDLKTQLASLSQGENQARINESKIQQLQRQAIEYRLQIGGLDRMVKERENAVYEVQVMRNNLEGENNSLKLKVSGLAKLENTLKDKQSTIKQTLSRVSQLQHKNTTLTQSLQTLTQQNSSLRFQYDGVVKQAQQNTQKTKQTQLLQVEIQTLKYQLDQAMNEAVGLRRKNQQVMGEKIKYERISRDVQEEKNRTKMEYQRIVDNLGNERANSQNLKNKLVLTETQIKRLTDLSRQAQITYNTIQSQLKQSKLNQSSLQSTNTQLERTLNQVRNTLVQLQKQSSYKYRNYETEILGLKNEIVVFQQQQQSSSTSSIEISNFESVLENLSKAENHIHFIQSQLSRLENQNNTLHQNVNEKNTAITNLQNALRQANSEKLQQEKQKSRLELTLKHSEEQKQDYVRKFQESYASLEEQFKRAENKNKAIDGELAELQRERQGLISRNKGYEEQIGQLQKNNNEMQVQLTAKIQQLRTQTSQIQNLQTSLSEKQRALAQQKRLKTYQQTQASQYQQAQKQSTEQISQLKSQIMRIPLLQNEVDRLLRESQRRAEEKASSEAIISQINAQNRQLQGERQRLNREVNSLTRRIQVNDEIVAALKAQMESKNAINLKVLGERDIQIKKLTQQRHNLIVQAAEATAKSQKLEHELKNFNKTLASIQQQKQKLAKSYEKLQQDYFTSNNLNNELRYKYENSRKQADEHKFRYNEAESHIKYLEFSIQDLNKNTLRLRESERKCQELLSKIKDIEGVLDSLLPNSVREKAIKVCKEFDEVVYKFNEAIEEQKEKIYQSIIKEYPEKEETLKKELHENKLKEHEKSMERDASIIDELNEKLITVEEQKHAILAELETLRHLKDVQARLAWAQTRIHDLQKQREQIPGTVIKSQDRISGIEGKQEEPEHIQSLILSENAISSTKEEIIKLKETLQERQGVIERLEEALRKQDEQNLGLKEEKDRILVNTNKLITEIDQIKREFASIETQAQNKFRTEIDTIQAKHKAQISQLQTKLSQTQSLLTKYKTSRDAVSPVKQFSFDHDSSSNKKSQSAGSSGIKSPLLSPRTKELQSTKEKVAGLENKLAIQQEQEKEFVEKIKGLYGELQVMQKGYQVKEVENVALKQNSDKIEKALEYAQAYIFKKEEEIVGLREQIIKLEKDQSTVKQNIEQLTKEIQILKAQISKLEADIIQKDRLIEELNKKYDGLHKEMLESKTKSQQQEIAEKQKLLAQISKLQSENNLQKEELAAKHKQLQFTKSKLETEVHLLEESFKDLEHKMQEKEEVLAKNNSALAEQQRTNKSLQQTLAERTEERKKLEIDNEGISKQMKDIESKINQILEEKNGLANVVTSLKTENQQLVEKNKQLADKKTSTELQVKQEYEKLKENVQVQSKKIQELAKIEKALEYAEGYIYEKENQIGKLKEQITKLERQQVLLKQNIQKLEKVIEDLQGQIKNLQAEMKGKNETITETRQKISNLQRQQIESKDRTQQQEAIERQKLVNRLEALEKEANQQKTQLAEKNRELQLTKSRLETENHLFEQSFKDLEHKMQEKQALLEKTNGVVRQERSKSEQSNRALRNQLADIQEKIKSMLKQNSNLAAAMNILSQENESLRKANFGTLSQVKQFEGVEQKHAQLQKEVQSLTSDNSKLNSEVSTQKAQIQKLQAEKQEKNVQLVAKEEQISFLKSQIDKIFEDNQLMKVSLDKQDQALKKMMVEIADLQDVSKKTEGEQVEIITQLRNQNTNLKKERQEKGSVLEQQVGKLRERLGQMEREKSNVQKELQSIETNHQQLSTLYNELRLALGKLIEGDEAMRGSSLTGTPIKQPQSQSFAPVVKPFESGQKSPSQAPKQLGQSAKRSQQNLQNIDKIARLLASSNDKMQELLKANADLANRVKESEKKYSNLLTQLESIERDDEQNQSKSQIQITQKSSQILQKQSQNTRLKDQLISIKKQFGLILDDNNKLADDNTKLAVELQKAVKDNYKLAKENGEIVTSNRDLEAKLKEKVEKQGNLIKENETIIRDLRQIQERLANVQQELEAQRKERQAEEVTNLNKIKQSEKEKAQAQRKTQTLTQQYKTLTQQLQTLSQQKTSLLSTIVGLKQQLAQHIAIQQQRDADSNQIMQVVGEVEQINQYIANYRPNLTAGTPRLTHAWLNNLQQTIEGKLGGLARDGADRERELIIIRQQNEKLVQALKRAQSKIGQLSVQQAISKPESQAIEQRYQQALTQLIHYESLNKELSDQIKHLSQEINIYKLRVQQFSKQAIDLSNQHEQNNSSSLENLELRKRLEDAEYRILQMQQSGGDIGEFNNQILVDEEERRGDSRSRLIEFLRDSLRKISSLEVNIDNLQLELNTNSNKLQKIIDNFSQDSNGLRQSSELKAQLEQLQHQLMANEREINDSCQNVDQVLKNIRQILDNQQQKSMDKQKVAKLINMLQNNIRQNQKLHEQELLNMALTLQGDKTDRSLEGAEQRVRAMVQQQDREEEGVGYKTERLTISDRVQLIKEIKELSKMIDIYHKEALRRKRKHGQVVNELKAQIQAMKAICGDQIAQNGGRVLAGSPIQKLMSKIQQVTIRLEAQSERIRKKDEEDSSGFGEIVDEEIVGRGQEEGNQMIESVRESLNGDKSEQQQKGQINIPSQANLDAKSFLEYILDNNQFDREQVLELKKKVAALKSKQNRHNMQILKQKQQELQKIYLKEKERISPNIDMERFIEAIASNIDQNQIPQLLNQESNHQLMDRIIQALNLSQIQQPRPDFRSLDSQLLAQQIRSIVSRYYPEPNRLSQALYEYILLLLSSPNDEVLLGIIDNIFSTILEVEQVYLNALEEKDQIFRQHSELMKQVLERSSSGDSEEIGKIEAGMMEEGEVSRSRGEYGSERKTP